MRKYFSVYCLKIRDISGRALACTGLTHRRPLWTPPKCVQPQFLKSVSLAWLARLPLPRANSNASQLDGLRLRANSKTSHLSGLRSRANSKTSHLIGLHSQAARAASEPIFLKCRPLVPSERASFFTSYRSNFAKICKRSIFSKFLRKYPYLYMMHVSKFQF